MRWCLRKQAWKAQVASRPPSERHRTQLPAPMLPMQAPGPAPAPSLLLVPPLPLVPPLAPPLAPPLVPVQVQVRLLPR